MVALFTTGQVDTKHRLRMLLWTICLCLAFYGVKAVATLYAKDPVSAGGLGVDLTKFGTLLMVWAFVQSFLPIFTGGLSDRYGYKETIFVSTVLKKIGRAHV